MNENKGIKELEKLRDEVKSLKESIRFMAEDHDEDDAMSINYSLLVKTLWHERVWYFKILPVAFVLAVVYAFSQPNYYQCEVKLSPELSSHSSNSLASLASNFGIKMGGASGTTDALFPTLYPDLMTSVKFKTSLFNIPVTVEGDETEGEADRTMSYYDYLKNEQQASWLSTLVRTPVKFAAWAKEQLFDTAKMTESKHVNPFRLTPEQTSIVKELDNKIVCDVNNKSMIITIQVTDQDPVVCATVANAVQNHLQDFITDYRTQKARIDLAYNKKLFKEAKLRYDIARKRYANYVDANRHAMLESVQSKREALENEMMLQYNAYTQVASLLMAAEAKVQEATPAFTTLQDATVPIEKSGPMRSQICFLVVFLAFLFTSVFIPCHRGNVRLIFRKRM